MKKLLKKIIVIVLLFVMVISNFQINVYANLQNAVNDFTISDFSDMSSDSYKINLRWKRPPASTIPDNSAIPADQNVQHQAEGYDIFYRNTTESEAYGTQPKASKVSTDDALNHEFNNEPFKNGSMYLFKVSPYHEHTYNVPTSNGGTVSVKKRAPIDPNGLKEKEIFYLTDLEVEATGSGKNMTVTWSNPTFDGKEVFSGYRIFYSLGGSGLSEIPENPHVDVSISNSDLKRTKDGKLEYTFFDADLQVGKFYAVKVEPLMNGNLLRNMNKLVVGLKTYDIAYTPIKREYRTNVAYVKPALNLKEEGLNNIRLYWDSFKNTIFKIEEIQIFKSDTPDFAQETKIGTITGEQSSRGINYWLAEKPSHTTYYRIKVSYKDENNKIETMISEYKIFDPKYADFSPYKPNILQTSDNAQKPLSMDITWEAFLREAYTEDEKELIDEVYKKYVDRNLIYDIWITDSADNLNDPAFAGKIIETVKASELVTIDTNINDKKKLGYLKTFDSYYKKSVSGGYEKFPLEDNKVYYIKIMATRDPSGEISQYATGMHYIMPVGDINTQPKMISKPPLRIKKNENGTDEINETEITIQWDKKWFEVYDVLGKSWESKVGIDPQGNIVYGKDAEALDPSKIFSLNDIKYQGKLSTAEGSSRIKADLIQNGANEQQANSLPIRFQDLKESKYEINAIKYDEMEKLGGYEAYLQTLIDLENEKMWTQIESEGDPEHPHHKLSELDKNTTYIIFFRPYYEDESGKKVAYFPNFVVGTTLVQRGDLDIIPTVPILEAVSTTDMTATVRWEYSKELTYELQIGEKSADFPDGGKKVAWDIIKENSYIKEDKGKNYLYYTFESLFPDTQFYIWIKAFANNKGDVVSSKPSNPVIVKTKDILPPEPPRGIGPASKENLTIYNRENNTELKAIEKDYMIIEWLKNENDVEPIESQKPDEKSTAEWIHSEFFLSSYMVKFKELMINKDYYIRAKTKLVVTRGAEDKIIRTYNYIIQLSPDPEFIDMIEIIIPPIDKSVVADANTKIKESDWSVTVKLFTAKSTDEYDGDKNPDLYPLPTDDFEIIYDSKTETLTYRLRSNQTDSEGNKDNLVDQRFISNLVIDKVFDYKIDLTKYNNKTVSKRVVEMPYSIFRTLNERKINLTLIADNISTKINYGAFETAEIKAIKDFGYTSTIKFSIEKNPIDAPKLKTTNGTQIESFSSQPQKVSVQIKTPTKTLNVKQLSKNIDIEMKLDHRYSVIDNNVSMYYHDGNTLGWQKIDSNYDVITGTMTMQTKKINNFSAISKIIPAIVGLDQNIDATYNIATSIELTDMLAYIPNSFVNATQFNNLINAVAKNKKSVAVNSSLSQEDLNSLTKSKLLVEGDYVQREAAFSSLARLYEIKSGKALKKYSDFEKTITDIKTIDPKYKTNILKAYEIGFVSEEIFKPKENITFSDLFYMIDIILSDSN